MSDTQLICILIMILAFAPFVSVALALISMDYAIKDERKRKERTNAECTKCKWYGLFTCECPHYCTGETREHFELILREEEE